MKKKLAFTLAEVLITLAIIGVIASTAIPTLLNSTSDNQNKVAWKKAYAELSQATQKIVYDNGGSLVNVFSSSADLKNVFIPYFNIIKDCPNARTGGCWHPTSNDWNYLDGSTQAWMDSMTNPGLILNSGTMMYFYLNASACNDPVGEYERCGHIRIDVNGFKEPNIVGKDIFPVNITKNTLVPHGTRGYAESTCATSGTGCSAEFLYK